MAVRDLGNPLGNPLGLPRRAGTPGQTVSRLGGSEFFPVTRSISVAVSTVMADPTKCTWSPQGYVCYCAKIVSAGSSSFWYFRVERPFDVTTLIGGPTQLESANASVPVEIFSHGIGYVRMQSTDSNGNAYFRAHLFTDPEDPEAGTTYTQFAVSYPTGLPPGSVLTASADGRAIYGWGAGSGYSILRFLATTPVPWDFSSSNASVQYLGDYPPTSKSIRFLPDNQSAISTISLLGVADLHRLTTPGRLPLGGFSGVEGQIILRPTPSSSGESTPEILSDGVTVMRTIVTTTQIVTAHLTLQGPPAHD